jgi:hypothetical protein
MGSLCRDPRLAILDSHYAYNSWSHDQYVVSPYNRADIKVTSSITVPNKIVLQLVIWPRLIMPRRASSQLSSRIHNSVDDPRHAYYPTGNWLGDVPSLHRHHRTHRHLPRSLLHSLTKLIARDKVVSTFELYSETI